MKDDASPVLAALPGPHEDGIMLRDIRVPGVAPEAVKRTLMSLQAKHRVIVSFRFNDKNRSENLYRRAQ